MFFVERIKIRPGALKGRAVTLSHRVEMNGMKPLRKPFDVYRYQHSVLGLAKGSGANAFSLGILISERELRVGARRVDQEG